MKRHRPLIQFGILALLLLSLGTGASVRLANWEEAEYTRNGEWALTMPVQDYRVTGISAKARFKGNLDGINDTTADCAVQEEKVIITTNGDEIGRFGDYGDTLECVAGEVTISCCPMCDAWRKEETFEIPLPACRFAEDKILLGFTLTPQDEWASACPTEACVGTFDCRTGSFKVRLFVEVTYEELSTEVCDGIDNDCNDDIDDGEICTGGFECVDGECSTTECATGRVLCDGLCELAPGKCCDGTWFAGGGCCGDEDCTGDQYCDDDHRCKEPECTDIAHCPGNFQCADHLCSDTDCRTDHTRCGAVCDQLPGVCCENVWYAGGDCCHDGGCTGENICGADHRCSQPECTTTSPCVGNFRCLDGRCSRTECSTDHALCGFTCGPVPGVCCDNTWFTEGDCCDDENCRTDQYCGGDHVCSAYTCSASTPCPGVLRCVDGICIDPARNFAPNIMVDRGASGKQLHSALVGLRGGALLSMWQDARTSDYHVRSSQASPPGYEWSTSVQVDSISFGDQGPPSVVTGPSDLMFAAWAGRDGSIRAAYVARSTDNGASWEPSRVISEDLDSPKDATVALGGGRLTVVFTAVASGYRSVYAVTSNSWGASWSSPVLIASGESARVGIPSVAIDANGIAVAVWEEGSSLSEAIYTARSTDGGRLWSERSRVDSAPGPWQIRPTLLATRDGGFLLAWDEEYDIYTSQSNDAGLTWSTKVLVFDASHGWRAEPMLAVADNGNAYVVWDSYYDIYTAYMPKGDTKWTEPARVDDSPEGTQQRRPAIAVDSEGVVHVAWEDNRNGDYAVHYSLSTPCKPGFTFCEARCIPSTEGRCCEGRWRVGAACCWHEECDGGHACDRYSCSSTMCAPGFVYCEGACLRLPGACCGGIWTKGAECCTDDDCTRGGTCDASLQCIGGEPVGPTPTPTLDPSASPSPTALPTVTTSPTPPPGATAIPGPTTKPTSSPTATPTPASEDVRQWLLSLLEDISRAEQNGDITPEMAAQLRHRLQEALDLIDAGREEEALMIADTIFRDVARARVEALIQHLEALGREGRIDKAVLADLIERLMETLRAIDEGDIVTGTADLEQVIARQAATIEAIELILAEVNEAELTATPAPTPASEDVRQWLLSLWEDISRAEQNGEITPEMAARLRRSLEQAFGLMVGGDVGGAVDIADTIFRDIARARIEALIQRVEALGLAGQIDEETLARLLKQLREALRAIDEDGASGTDVQLARSNAEDLLKTVELLATEVGDAEKATDTQGPTPGQPTSARPTTTKDWVLALWMEIGRAEGAGEITSEVAQRLRHRLQEALDLIDAGREDEALMIADTIFRDVARARVEALIQRLEALGREGHIDKAVLADLIERLIETLRAIDEGDIVTGTADLEQVIARQAATIEAIELVLAEVNKVERTSAPVPTPPPTDGTSPTLAPETLASAVLKLIETLREDVQTAEEDGLITPEKATEIHQRLSRARALLEQGRVNAALEEVGRVAPAVARARLEALIQRVEALGRDGLLDEETVAELLGRLRNALRDLEEDESGTETLPVFDRMERLLKSVDALTDEVEQAAVGETPVTPSTGPVPTMVPSLVPTLIPTTVPTTSPTTLPDGSVTLLPTLIATMVPSMVPTMVPGPGPTASATDPNGTDVAGVPGSGGELVTEGIDLDQSSIPSSVPADPVAAAIHDLAEEMGCAVVCAGRPEGCDDACEDLLDVERKVASPLFQERLLVQMAVSSTPPPGLERHLQSAWRRLDEGDVTGVQETVQRVQGIIKERLAIDVAVNTVSKSSFTPQLEPEEVAIPSVLELFDIESSLGETAEKIVDGVVAASKAVRERMGVVITGHVMEVALQTAEGTGEPKIATVVTLSVENTGTDDEEDFCILQLIPKALASSVTDVTFRQDVRVVVNDPVVLWSVDRLKSGSKVDLSFSVQKQVSQEDVEASRITFLKLPGHQCRELSAKPGGGSGWGTTTAGGALSTIKSLIPWIAVLMVLSLIGAAVRLRVRRGHGTLALSIARQARYTAVTATARNTGHTPMLEVAIEFELPSEVAPSPDVSPHEAVGTIPAGGYHMSMLYVTPRTPARSMVGASITYRRGGKQTTERAPPVSVASVLPLVSPLTMDEEAFEEATSGLVETSRSLSVKGGIRSVLDSVKQVCSPLAQAFAHRKPGGRVDEGYIGSEGATGETVAVKVHGKRGVLGDSLTITCFAGTKGTAEALADELVDRVTGKESPSYYGTRYT